VEASGVAQVVGTVWFLAGVAVLVARSRFTGPAPDRR
jgi:hypothetical protein